MKGGAKAGREQTSEICNRLVRVGQRGSGVSIWGNEIKEEKLGAWPSGSLACVSPWVPSKKKVKGYRNLLNQRAAGLPIRDHGGSGLRCLEKGGAEQWERD